MGPSSSYTFPRLAWGEPVFALASLTTFCSFPDDSRPWKLIALRLLGVTGERASVLCGTSRTSPSTTLACVFVVPIQASFPRGTTVGTSGARNGRGRAAVDGVCAASGCSTSEYSLSESSRVTLFNCAVPVRRAEI
jgi:hypothetical protein